MIYQLLKGIILPPTPFILLILFGLLATRRRGDIGWWAALVSSAALYALSTPFVADTLLSSLETFPPVTPQAVASKQAQAIVVLSAESEIAPEFGGSTVGPLTLARLRYGAHLQSLTQLPMLVAGGPEFVGAVSRGEQMKATLQSDYGISQVWVEGNSQTTWENAVRSAEILKEKGVERIYLVTHAWHMRRAYKAFVHAGVKVTAAPTAFTGRGDLEVYSLLPSAKAVMTSYFALHEIFGGWFYEIEADCL